METHASDGLATMMIPDGYEDVMAELKAGTEVCEALAMLWTADTQREFEGDSAAIRALLEAFPY